MPSFAHDSMPSTTSTPDIVFVTGYELHHGHHGLVPQPDIDVSYTINESARRVRILGFIQIPVSDTIPPRFGVVLNVKNWTGTKEVKTLSLDLRPHEVILTRLDCHNNSASTRTYLVPEGPLPTSAPFPYRLY
jgi:hypothetical protein